MKTKTIVFLAVIATSSFAQAQGAIDISEDVSVDTDSLAGSGGTLDNVGTSTHVVKDGDTLWDICVAYFNDPWRWPKIWSLNPSITNPHWIFPGDIVRLREGGAAAPSPTQPGVVSASAPLGKGTVEVPQLAFVSTDDLKKAMKIVGSPDEKTMLAAGDTIYFDYKEENKPSVGQRLTIYDTRKPVFHPSSKAHFGNYITIRGEAEVRSVKDGKRARAYVLKTRGIVERGMRLGPVKAMQGRFQSVANGKSLASKIIGIFEKDSLIGQSQVVFVDLGKDDGVSIGNRLCVVRRGDGYGEVMEPSFGVGQNDKKYPARAIGDIMLVEVGEKASVAFVVSATTEIGVGDRLIMIKNKLACQN